MADAMDDGEVDADADEEYEKVIAGLGLEIAEDGLAIPSKKIKDKAPAIVEEEKDAELDDLAARMMKI